MVSEGFEIVVDFMVPSERERAHIVAAVPQFTYIRNEQHYKKHKKRRNKHEEKALNNKDGAESDEISDKSFTTNKVMPALANPKRFRWKSNLCKSAFGDAK